MKLDATNFSRQFPRSTSTLLITSDKLLRLRKDLPTTLPVAISQEAWERVIKPLFAPDQIVQQELVRLRPARVIETLNEELRQREEKNQETSSLAAAGYLRPTKREGIYLADDEFGLVITNMTPGT